LLCGSFFLLFLYGKDVSKKFILVAIFGSNSALSIILFNLFFIFFGFLFFLALKLGSFKNEEFHAVRSAYEF